MSVFVNFFALTDGSCSFEHDMCGYTQGTGGYGEFNWTRQSANDFTPEQDHTTGTEKGK